MPTPDSAPIGAPCWTDLWTSDVEGSRKFYAELFGWKAEEPSEEFGGYFMFTRDGVPVAGGMGAMGDQEANDAWQIYLTTDDIDKTAEAAEAAGGQVIAPVMPVADLGSQAILADPAGASHGIWQPGTFPGFTVLGEPGAPSWFELHTSDYDGAIDFYRTVHRWEINTVGDSDEFRYSTMQDPSGDGELAGIMDASGWLPEGVGAHWSIYWYTDSMDATISKLKALGGSVVAEPEDTPYGILATVADPAGAQFKLHTPSP